MSKTNKKKTVVPTVKTLTEQFASYAKQGFSIETDTVGYTLVTNEKKDKQWSGNTHPFSVKTKVADGKTTLIITEEGKKSQTVPVTVVAKKVKAAEKAQEGKKGQTVPVAKKVVVKPAKANAVPSAPVQQPASLPVQAVKVVAPKTVRFSPAEVAKGKVEATKEGINEVPAV